MKSPNQPPTWASLTPQQQKQLLQQLTQLLRQQLQKETAVPLKRGTNEQPS